MHIKQHYFSEDTPIDRELRLSFLQKVLANQDAVTICKIVCGRLKDSTNETKAVTQP